MMDSFDSVRMRAPGANVLRAYRRNSTTNTHQTLTTLCARITTATAAAAKWIMKWSFIGFYMGIACPRHCQQPHKSHNLAVVYNSLLMDCAQLLCRQQNDGADSILSLDHISKYAVHLVVMVCFLLHAANEPIFMCVAVCVWCSAESAH